MAKKEQTQAPAPQTEEAKPAAPNIEKGAKLTPITKITVRDVCGTPQTSKLPPLKINISDDNPDGEPNPEAELFVMKVAGYINGVKDGQGAYGPWKGLSGNFSAINMGTGEVFASKTCILPGPMNEALYDTASEKLAEDASTQIAFKVNVYVKRSARDKNKYEFIVRPVIETAFQSPSLALLTAD